MKNELKELQQSIDELRARQQAKQLIIDKLSAQAPTISERIKEVLFDAYELNYRSYDFHELEREIKNISTSDMIVEEKELRLKVIETIIAARERQQYFNELFTTKKQS